MRRNPWRHGLLVATLLLLPPIAAACPMCKEALFDPTQAATASRTATGYALSIALLMLTPLSLVAGMALWIARSIKRASRHRGDEFVS